MTLTTERRELETGRTDTAFATGGVLAVAGMKLALQLAFLTGYGWHRDEFYYLVGGRHLDPGYVDHPLLVPWLAKAVDVVVGPSLGALRLVPALVGATVVVLTALLARELGGGRRAQVVAALCVALDPLLIGINHFFQTPSFDELAWVAATLALVRLLRTGDERWWVGVGAACGFGLLAKPSILLWMLAVGIGLLVTPARWCLRSRWLVAGLGIAAVAGLPMLWFQLQHAWPFPEFVRHMNARTAGEERPKFVPGQLVLHDPVAAFVWIPGLVALFRDRDLRPFRAFGWAYAVAFAFFLVTGGKAYYLGPVYPLLFAAGAAVLARRWTRFPRALVAGMVVVTALTLPAGLPVLPVSSFADSPYYGLNHDALEQVGWHRLVRTVTRAVDHLPASERARAAVVTGNYGEAGALDVLGALTVPVRSRQNSYWLWGREPPAAGAVFVTVGWGLDREFTGCHVVARVDTGAPNDEQHAPVAVCSGLRGAWRDVWSRLKLYT